MRVGFFDAEEMRERHAAFNLHRDADRAQTARAIEGGHRAVDASWAVLARSKAIVEEADRFARAREIHTLADELLASEQYLIDTNDDGAILAAIFPHHTSR